MDNSLIELGHPLPPADILRAAELVRARAIVLPDKLGDAAFTVRASEQAALDLGKPPAYAGYMCVVQGQNVEEVMQCAEDLVSLPHVKYLSIPRVLANLGMSRIDLAQKIYDRHKLPLHLLGFSDNMRDDMMAATMSGVMGIDSAMPIWLGAKGQSLPSAIPPRNIFGSRPETFWTDNMKTAQQVININRVRRWIKSRKEMSRKGK